MDVDELAEGVLAVLEAGDTASSRARATWETTRGVGARRPRSGVSVASPSIVLAVVRPRALRGADEGVVGESETSTASSRRRCPRPTAPPAACMSLARLAPPLTLKRSVIDISHIPCCLPDGSFTVRLPTDPDPTFRAEAPGASAPYYWDARLELQYSLIHPLAWEALVGDDCDDALRKERLAFWLPDTVGNSSEREAVLQSYEQLAWRRLHRWQRILGALLPCLLALAHASASSLGGTRSLPPCCSSPSHERILYQAGAFVEPGKDRRDRSTRTRCPARLAVVRSPRDDALGFVFPFCSLCKHMTHSLIPRQYGRYLNRLRCVSSTCCITAQGSAAPLRTPILTRLSSEISTSAYLTTRHSV